MFGFLSEMRKWWSTPLDKVAGLAHSCCIWCVPIYREDQSEEEAWTALVNAMSVRKRAYLLFFYPEPGDGDISWRPSWRQVMAKPLPSLRRYSVLQNKVERMEKADVDVYKGPRIDSGDVPRMADGSQDGTPQQGELVVKDDSGTLHTIQIVADHAYPILDGVYTLIGGKARFDYLSENFEYVYMRDWVVGRWTLEAGREI
ncbi:uncharacterized protein EV420DRAFT_1571983 [Desarmillaria tabescens]|uniref:Uncharacterized protein n=1 Tax=Armillaria tabescens TaxID=1929756 RepID=A0AA39JMT6_ARMTA|nr:uncharacterized protein EV420DRAFT_1571983 [Desarmillaria tabescens]KAK0445645.1 hypothetical protein EV420DRAFT_1571983 [Desarmillaria tabescens]